MNALEGRNPKRRRVTPWTALWVLSMSTALHPVFAQGTPAAASKPAETKASNPVSPSVASEVKAAAVPTASRPILLVRPSMVPLGDNSVLTVSPQEARQELQGIESGLFRRSLAEPKVMTVPEQGGWVRGFFKEPKASKLWSFFNPKAPVDTETDLMRSARIFGIRGDAPLPTSMQDPIQIEPVGIRFWQINK